MEHPDAEASTRSLTEQDDDIADETVLASRGERAASPAKANEGFVVWEKWLEGHPPMQEPKELSWEGWAKNQEAPDDELESWSNKQEETEDDKQRALQYLKQRRWFAAEGENLLPRKYFKAYQVLEKERTKLSQYLMAIYPDQQDAIDLLPRRIKHWETVLEKALKEKEKKKKEQAAIDETGLPTEETETPDKETISPEVAFWEKWKNKQNQIKDIDRRSECYRKQRDLFMEQFNDPDNENYYQGLTVLGNEKHTLRDMMAAHHFKSALQEHTARRTLFSRWSENAVKAACKEMAIQRIIGLEALWDKERKENQQQELEENLTPDEIILHHAQVLSDKAKDLEDEVSRQKNSLQQLEKKRDELLQELGVLPQWLTATWKNEAERAQIYNKKLELQQLQSPQYGGGNVIPNAKKELEVTEKKLEKMRALIETRKARVERAEVNKKKTEAQREQRKLGFDSLSNAVKALNASHRGTDEEAIANAEQDLTNQISTQLDNLPTPSSIDNSIYGRMRQRRQQIMRIDELHNYLHSSLSVVAKESEIGKAMMVLIGQEVEVRLGELQQLQDEQLLERQQFDDKINEAAKQDKLQMPKMLTQLGIINDQGPLEPLQLIKELSYLPQRIPGLRYEMQLNKASIAKIDAELENDDEIDSPERVYLQHERDVLKQDKRDLLQEAEEGDAQSVRVIMQAQILLSTYARQLSAELFEESTPTGLAGKAASLGKGVVSAFTGEHKRLEKTFHTISSVVDAYETTIASLYRDIPATHKSATVEGNDFVQTHLWQQLVVPSISSDNQSLLKSKHDQAKQRREDNLKKLRDLEMINAEQIGAKLPPLLEEMRIERMQLRIELWEVYRQQQFHQSIKLELTHRLKNPRSDQDDEKQLLTDLHKNKIALARIRRREHALHRDMAKELNVVADIGIGVFLSKVMRYKHSIKPDDKNALAVAQDLTQQGGRLLSNFLSELDSFRIFLKEFKHDEFPEEKWKELEAIGKVVPISQQAVQQLNKRLETNQKIQNEVRLISTMGDARVISHQHQELLKLQKERADLLKQKANTETRIFLSVIKLASTMNAMCRDGHEPRQEALQQLSDQIQKADAHGVEETDEPHQQACHVLERDIRSQWQTSREERESLLEEMTRLDEEGIRQLVHHVGEMEGLVLHLEKVAPSKAAAKDGVAEELHTLQEEIQNDLNDYVEALYPALEKLAKETQSPILKGEAESFLHRYLDLEDQQGKGKGRVDAPKEPRKKAMAATNVDRESLHYQYQLLQSRARADARRYQELTKHLQIVTSEAKRDQKTHEQQHIEEKMLQAKNEICASLADIIVDLRMERLEKSTEIRKLQAENQRDKLTTLQEEHTQLQKEEERIEYLVLQAADPVIAGLPSKYDIAENFGEGNVRGVRKNDRLDRVVKAISNHAFIIRLAEPNLDEGPQTTVAITKEQILLLGRKVENFQEGKQLSFKVNATNEVLEAAGKARDDALSVTRKSSGPTR
ncbi:MAG: hypothetical protein V4568_00050 [Pseudomonadota bacterium]